MIPEKYSLEQTVTTAFTRKQICEEVYLQAAHKPENLQPLDIAKTKVKRRSKESLDQLTKKNPLKIVNSMKSIQTQVNKFLSHTVMETSAAHWGMYFLIHQS